MKTGCLLRRHDLALVVEGEVHFDMSRSQRFTEGLKYECAGPLKRDPVASFNGAPVRVRQVSKAGPAGVHRCRSASGLCPNEELLLGLFGNCSGITYQYEWRREGLSQNR